MNPTTAIELRGISKTFHLDRVGTVSLFQRLRAMLRPDGRATRIEALRDIDLSIEQGERIGVIGTNGSGKTTLMRVIAGLYEPTSGRLDVQGRVASFLQLGTGTIQKLSVRENIFLYGAILGLTRKEVHARYDSIVSFAELSGFEHVEVGRLSSGMAQRLSFAVAVQVDADVLLLDEILAVGDQSFRNKCYDYFATALPEDRTVIFSSHTLNEIETFCGRTLWLEQGRIVRFDETDAVLAEYREKYGDLETVPQGGAAMRPPTAQPAHPAPEPDAISLPR